MRRPSAADEARSAERARISALTPGERVRLALELGERSLSLYCERHGTARETARRLLESRRQSGRRPSRCIEALVAHRD